MPRSRKRIIALAVALAGALTALLVPNMPRSGRAATGSSSTMVLVGLIRDFRGAHADFNVSFAPRTAGIVAIELGPDDRPRAMSTIESSGTNGASTSNRTVSKWGFDESGDPTTAADNRGGHDAILRNGVQRVKGRFGDALYFDGVDDFIEVPHHDDFMLDDATIALWFNAADPSRQQGLVGKDANGYVTGGHVSVFLNDSRLEVRLQSTGEDYWLYSSSDSIKADRWHHVAFGFGGDGMRLYLDGTLVDEDPGYTGGLASTSGGSGNFAPWVVGVSTWRAGNLSTGGWELPFEGYVDEFQLFEGQIAQDEFQLTGGYIVANQWKNGLGEEIPPHLASGWCGGLVPMPPCIDAALDVPGSVGVSGNGQIRSPESFDQWFRDVLGTNYSLLHAIELTRNDEGIYEHLDVDFHPIDRDGFGNEGSAHNDFYTYELCGTFRYDECAGQFISFAGGDGAWVFIDGKLALEIGGTESIDTQVSELDRLCLTDGETYEFRLFYAQRMSGTSIFQLRTNVEIDTCERHTVSGSFD